MSWSPEDDEKLPPRRVASCHCQCEMCGADPVETTTLDVEDYQ